jgi:small multidrug resistance family-3 protein
MRLSLFALAALFEIGGCYLVWQAWRHGHAWLWFPALLALASFAWLLALAGTDSAGRAFAIYGGVYIAASLVFMASVEQIRPDRWDLLGAAICLLGAAVILWAPRA